MNYIVSLSAGAYDRTSPPRRCEESRLHPSQRSDSVPHPRPSGV